MMHVSCHSFARFPLPSRTPGLPHLHGQVATRHHDAVRDLQDGVDVAQARLVLCRVGAG